VDPPHAERPKKANDVSIDEWRIGVDMRHHERPSHIARVTGAWHAARRGSRFPQIDAVMDRWLPEILAAVNDDAAPFGFALSGDARARLRERLEWVCRAAKGEKVSWPDLAPQWLPRLGVGVVNGVRMLTIEEPPPSPKWPIPTDQAPAPPEYEEVVCAVAVALSIHPQGALLRQCDWAACGAFFLARSNHRREHSFCCQAHRRAYDVAHRDPATVAAYMREHRRELARRRKRKARGRRSGR
jgi:hypothetical protein